MKIAFNAIRVSNKAGSGFDTFIINFINTFAKYIYSEFQTPNSELYFDVYTLYPYHFPEVKKEDIKHIKIPFLSWRRNTKSQRTSNSIGNKQQTKKIFSFLTPIYYLLSTIYCLFGDYFRMFWTQFIFPFYALRYDLVISLTEYEASVFFSKRQIIIMHSVVLFLFRNFPKKYKLYVSFLLPEILKKCRKIIVVSETLKSQLQQIFSIPEDKIFVLYEGVDTQKFRPASKEEILEFKKELNLPNRYVLMVGHSHPVKNFSRILESFKYVKEKIHCELVIAGYIGKNLKLPLYVRYVGHVTNEKLYLLYSAAECFVFASLYEGFGLPPLEAMACGCPVVVSNSGSLPEVCGDAAIYVDPYNPKDIAEGIIKVLSNETLRQELIKRGFKQIKKFTWEKSAQRFMELLKNI